MQTVANQPCRFQELLERQPGLAFTITRELSNRLRATDNATIESLKEANFELTRAYNKTLEGWAKALELRDQETEGHTRRVTEMTVKTGRSIASAGRTVGTPAPRRHAARHRQNGHP